MNIILKSPPKSKLKYYLFYSFSLVLIITSIIYLAVGWLLALALIVPLSLIIPYAKISNRMIYEIEINDENKFITFYYFVIYKNKKKTIHFQNLKFEIRKTTDLVSKKIKYDIIFFKKKWPIGFISNHDKHMQEWSTEDIEFLIQFYNSNIKPEHKK